MFPLPFASGLATSQLLFKHYQFSYKSSCDSFILIPGQQENRLLGPCRPSKIVWRQFLRLFASQLLLKNVVPAAFNQEEKALCSPFKHFWIRRLR